MGLFDFLKPVKTAESTEQQRAAEARQLDIAEAIKANRLPQAVSTRLTDARDGRLPWVATLTPAELMVARSHGLRPIAMVSATCWMQYGWSWTLGHAEGWSKALRRLKAEAVAAGANAVLDVKMRTVPLSVENSLDFTLIGTAVRVEGLPASSDPIVATVPSLEFVKLLEANVVPTGIAIGAHYEWQPNFGVWNMTTPLADDWRNIGRPFQGNQENRFLTGLLETVRQQAHAKLRLSARDQGNGVLAHVNFSQMFEREERERRQFLARHIVVATTVDARPGAAIPHPIKMALDMQQGRTPLIGRRPHHQTYASNEEEGPI